MSPTPRISPTSSVARCCVVLWIFHTKNSIFLFQGLASQVDKFVEEEVEVRQIPHISDGNLRTLGFVTIGSRQRLRSAAAAWVPQVICLCSFDCHVLKKSFLQIQRYALVYPRKKNDINVMPEKTYSCFSNRSPMQTPPWSRRRRMRNKLQMVLERERSCDWFVFRNNVHH